MSSNDYANFGKRFAAYLIDGLFLWIISFIAFYIIPTLITPAIIGWLYFAFMESSPKMATLGKQALGIVVTDMEGNRISFGKATGRYFGKIISSLFFCVGYLMAAWTVRRQALHDIMAGTLVLNGNANSSFSNYASSAAPSNYAKPQSYGRGPMIYGVAGEFVGKSFSVSGSGLTLGRDVGSCQVIFSATSAGISRIHCSIYFNSSSGVFVLTDAGSTYGTFHEKGMKLSQGQSINLRPGERFYLANQKNMFEVRG